MRGAQVTVRREPHRRRRRGTGVGYPSRVPLPTLSPFSLSTPTLRSYFEPTDVEVTSGDVHWDKDSGLRVPGTRRHLPCGAFVRAGRGKDDLLPGERGFGPKGRKLLRPARDVVGERDPSPNKVSGNCGLFVRTRVDPPGCK